MSIWVAICLALLLGLGVAYLCEQIWFWGRVVWRKHYPSPYIKDVPPLVVDGKIFVEFLFPKGGVKVDDLNHFSFTSTDFQCWMLNRTHTTHRIYEFKIDGVDIWMPKSDMPSATNKADIH